MQPQQTGMDVETDRTFDIGTALTALNIDETRFYNIVFGDHPEGKSQAKQLVFDAAQKCAADPTLFNQGKYKSAHYVSLATALYKCIDAVDDKAQAAAKPSSTIPATPQSAALTQEEVTKYPYQLVGLNLYSEMHNITPTAKKPEWQNRLEQNKRAREWLAELAKYTDDPKVNKKAKSILRELKANIEELLSCSGDNDRRIKAEKKLSETMAKLSDSKFIYKQEYSVKNILLAIASFGISLKCGYKIFKERSEDRSETLASVATKLRS